MGKKISVDSSTMMNKVYEIIEAKKIFNIHYKKISILIHPKSYIHAIVQFKDGMTKIIAHETTMEIPIYNTLIFNNKKKILTKKINIIKLNNLSLDEVNSKRYPIINLLKLIPNNHSLFETIIVSTNDVLVELFLKKQIKFNQISTIFFKVINDGYSHNLIIATWINSGSLDVNWSINIDALSSVMLVVVTLISALVHIILSVICLMTHINQDLCLIYLYLHLLC